MGGKLQRLVSTVIFWIGACLLAGLMTFGLYRVVLWMGYRLPGWAGWLVFVVFYFLIHRQHQAKPARLRAEAERMLSEADRMEREQTR
ncbi:hypothetical protein [Laribacter hongkongensis]|uniref:hypothetical protein n=1 Tax=Laribacter hongkongensis TaxID=168471 RepID=UPI00040054E3|nr:hypothetical protein [Laribacter hongkongensis]